MINTSQPELIGFIRQLLAVLLLGLLSFEPAGAQSAEELQSQLQQVKKNIEQLSSEQKETLEQRDSILSELALTDQQIGELSLSVRTTDQQLKKQTDTIQQLDQRESELSQKLGKQRQALEQQIRSAYAMGRQQHLKLWFNQDDASKLGRSLAYYRYLNSARIQAMQQFHAQLTELEQVNLKITAEKQQLTQTKQTLSTQQAKLQQLSSRQNSLIKSLNQRAGKQQNELTQLNREQADVQSLIRKLGDIFADIPKELSSNINKMKGQLNWPVRGSFKIRPGIKKSGGMDIQGALISTEPSAPVLAISHGRIAYADWLRGFGLLIIIDHGDGYMSLYGFNEALLKEVGDWVDRDELIAYTGTSGAQSESSLYFELRHDGQPIRLRGWFSSNKP